MTCLQIEYSFCSDCSCSLNRCGSGLFCRLPKNCFFCFFLKNLLFSVLHGTSSAYVGELFNFVMGSVFSFSAGYIYARNKSRKGALIGAVVGAALMAVLSVPFNYLLVYPAYVVCYGLPLDAIIGMYQAILPSSDSLIKCLTIFNMPFTFFKGMLDVVLCFLIYKPLSPLLHK